MVNEKKKILYLMNVDWAWIAQRPHFLANELGKYYDVTVVYLKQYIKRWKSQTSVTQTNKEAHGVYFPKQEKIKLLKNISDWSFVHAMGNLNQYDIIWISNPDYYHWIKGYKGTIIYDCMDNYSAFANSKDRMIQIQTAEKQLISRANWIFYSSDYLKEEVLGHISDGKDTLLRNGFRYTKIYPIKEEKNKVKYKLGYIGTISTWMDYESLYAVLDKFTDIEIHMIGPNTEWTKGYTRERLIFDGVVEHDKLYAKVEDYDCLIMPFIINDITEAVDPVKLYEYISFGKTIISVYYDEIKRFDDMVYFYHSSKEFVDVIASLREKGFTVKYSEQKQKKFLEENSWELRGKVIKEIING